MEGVTFLIKYLGKEAVENDNEEEQTTAAIKDIITKASMAFILAGEKFKKYNENLKMQS